MSGASSENPVVPFTLKSRCVVMYLISPTGIVNDTDTVDLHVSDCPSPSLMGCIGSIMASLVTSDFLARSE